MVRFSLCLFLVCLFSADLVAHTRSQSSSSWRIDGNKMSMAFTVDAYRATLLASFGWDDLSPAQMLERHLPDTITVTQAAKTCIITGAQTRNGARGKLRHEMTFHCPKPASVAPVDVKVDAFFALSASHQHIFYAQLENGQKIERILTEGHSAVSLIGAASEGDGPEIIQLGFEHVLSGLDHILFLFALVFLSRNWLQTAGLITCFTLGHMASLYLVAIDAVSPSSRLIEMLIGLSIAAVAVAALARSHTLPKRSPYIVTVLYLLGGSFRNFAAT